MKTSFSRYHIQPENQEDPELAFIVWLEGMTQQKELIITPMVQRYAAPLMGWVEFLLVAFSKKKPAPAIVSSITVAVFKDAIQDLENFQGERSFQNWLFKKAVPVVKRGTQGLLPFRKRGGEGLNLPGQYWATVIKALTWDIASAFFLWKIYGVEIADAAQLLSLPKNRIEKGINYAFRVIEVETLSENAGLEALTIEAEKLGWVNREVDPSEISNLLTLLETKPGSVASRLVHRSRFWEISLVGLILLTLFGVVWFINQRDSSPAIALFPPTPVPALPPVEPEELNIVAQVAVDDQVETDLSDYQYLGYPRISESGRWVAFSASTDYLVPEDTNKNADIFIYDQETGETRRINLGPGGVQADGWSFEPTLSADGRWIAYVSNALNLLPEKLSSCTGCAHVFLFDQETGQTTWVSKPANSKAGDGLSYSPTLSDDGRWLTFLSTAKNLVPGPEPECSAPEHTNCTFLYLYDREKNLLERVGGQNGIENVIGYSPISTNGKVVLITIGDAASDPTTSDLGVNSQVYIYDRVQDILSPINSNMAGMPGNGSSVGGDISADGRYVVFASLADNLVPGDNNQNFDIFLKDRLSGIVTLISQSIYGGSANGNSAGIWDLRAVSMTSDSRYIIYTSDARDLITGELPSCPPVFERPFCNNLYIYDRAIRETKLVESVGSDAVLMPDISGDGRWVVYAEHFFFCIPPEPCTQIGINDLQRAQKITIGAPPKTAMVSKTGWVYQTSLQGHQRRVNTLDFSPDGRFLASGSSDGSVIIWGFPSKTMLQRIPAHPAGVVAVSFNPDGTSLATAAQETTVFIWRLTNSEKQFTLEAHPGMVQNLEFSPDGKYLAVGALRSVSMWEFQEEGVLLRNEQYYPGGFVETLAFSPDSQLFALSPGDDTAWIREVPNGREITRLGGHIGKVNHLAFSPDGKFIAVGGQDGRINVWEILSQSRGRFQMVYRYTLEYTDRSTTLAFAPDGGILAVGSTDGTIRFWQIENGELLDTLTGAGNQILTLAFSPDGRYLAAGTLHTRILLWENLKK